MIADKRFQSAACCAGLLLVLTFCSLAHAQQISIPAGADASSALSSQAASTASSSPGADAALPASQIIELLHEKPELMVDLKKLAAEQLQAQGVAIQEDSITDEMLLGKIVSDASVRSNITLWLRARGYVTTADIEQAKAGTPDSEEDDSQTLSPSTPRIPSASDSDMSQLLASRADLAQAGGSLPGSMPTDIGSMDGLTAADLQRPSSKRSASRAKVTNPTTEPNPDGSPDVLHKAAPMNLMAMRDLYTQVPDQNSSLKRFGADVFLTRGMQSKQTPLDLPVGPDYVLGPGDSININLFGGLGTAVHPGR